MTEANTIPEGLPPDWEILNDGPGREVLCGPDEEGCEVFDSVEKARVEAWRRHEERQPLFTNLITVVTGYSEWEGVYLNGNLLVDGSAFIAGRCLEPLAAALFIPVEHIEVSDNWMQEEGRLPQLLEDIPAEARVKS
jgi:hypothetical protein